MGRYVMLPLRGEAVVSRGLSTQGPSCVVRLRSPHGLPAPLPADFALVRSREELVEAARIQCNGVMIVSDDCLERLPEAAHCPRLIRVPAKFNYFADGDIVGLLPQSGKFRTLYRRASKHNSFLVTDRCNHYCLMCSQPPKDIDDRWLLAEIKTVLPLVAKDTQFISFTGGEPMLDWREFLGILGISRDPLPNTTIHVLSNVPALIPDHLCSPWPPLQHPHLSCLIP